MSSLPLEMVREWMSFINRDTIDACCGLSRKLVRIVDTAKLWEYATLRNYNVTVAWTVVGKSRRGKPKEQASQ